MYQLLFGEEKFKKKTGNINVEEIDKLVTIYFIAPQFRGVQLTKQSASLVSGENAQSAKKNVKVGFN